MLKNNSNLNRQTNNGCSNKSSFSSTTSSSSTSTCGSSTAGCNTPATATVNGASMPRAHFESILKYILNDYVRLKNENDTLRKELDEKKITSPFKTITNINESTNEIDNNNNNDVSVYKFLFKSKILCDLSSL
jgi:hypothetical protein